MAIMHSEWRDRLRHWIRTLKDDFYLPLGEIRWTAYRTMEELGCDAVLKEAFAPVEPGFTWGKEYEYCWFAGSITLPKEAKGERIVLNLQPDGESCLFVNGKAFGTYRADWVKQPHHYFEDNTLVRCAEGGEHFDILMETYAGHYYPNAESCATGPVMPGAFEDPAVEGRRRTLGVCTYGIWNEDAYQLYMDISTLMGLLEVQDKTSLRAAHIADALEQFSLIVDFEQDRAGRIADYRKAREAVKPVLAAVNGSTAPTFYAVGNSHLDLAWLWPFAETRRKTERTFAAQLRLIEEYPDYVYIQSQPEVYEMCRKYYPELFKRIQEAVKGGQWIADGAMWVEPDTNMAGGEALIRQLLYGKRYYKEYFDVDSEILWLPDTFGYSAALPQILKGCHVKYLVTQKIFWSYNEGEQFPYHYFNWEGMDGTEIVSFLPTDYTYDTDPVTINNVWKNRAQTRDLEAFLLPYGYGDGGGGPARDHIEYALRQKNLEGGAKVKLAGPTEFFEDMEALGGPKHTYVGELYFSAHRGTYTSQAMVKNNNRRCELALREAEMWSALAAEQGASYPAEELEAVWKRFLPLQFHDILPGSCIGRVYREVKPVYEEILDTCAALTARAQKALTKTGEGITVFNSLGFERTVLVTLPERFAGGAVTAEGEAVQTEVSGGKVQALVTIPAYGAVSLLPGTDRGVKGSGNAGAVSLLPGTDKGVKCDGIVENETTECPVHTIISESMFNKRERMSSESEADRVSNFVSSAHIEKATGGYCMENGLVKAFISENGEITSFVLKSSGREFAAGGMNHLQMYKDVPRKFDAWDIDSNYILQETPGAHDVSTEILCADGLKAVLQVSGRIGNSSYTQQIGLTAGSRRIEVSMTIDWKEQHRLLKTAFPVSVYAEEGINEIQFGYVKRPTHRSRAYEQERFEVCNHRYSALCDGAHGAAVLNDCKYGISMNGNRLELTLLTAACSPEMRADNGVHHFTYAFTAWEGDFADCDVVKQAYELNVQPTLCIGAEAKQASNFASSRDNIILETVKLAEDGSGDVIVRLYEAKKASGRAEIFMPALEGHRAFACDMLENEETEIPVNGNCIRLDFRAFEVKTVRIKK